MKVKKAKKIYLEFAAKIPMVKIEKHEEEERELKSSDWGYYVINVNDRGKIEVWEVEDANM